MPRRSPPWSCTAHFPICIRPSQQPSARSAARCTAGPTRRPCTICWPSAVVLKGHAEALCRDRGLKDLFETAVIVEREVTAAMEREGKKIYPNVDFYSG